MGIMCMMPCYVLRVQGLGFAAWGSGLRARGFQGSGLRAWAGHRSRGGPDFLSYAR